MIRRLEALRFRPLRYIGRELGSLQVLFGPNGTGKSTLLDAIDFLGDLVDGDPYEVALERAPDWRDLLWRNTGDSFELAVEAEIPEPLRAELEEGDYRRCRYQVALGAVGDDGDPAFGIREETLGLRPERASETDQPELFPEGAQTPDSLMHTFRTRDTKTVIHKIPEGHDHFYDETGGGWSPTFKLGPQRSALAHLPEDPSKFPVATWFKRLLSDRLSRMAPQPELMRRGAPPGRGEDLRGDGANLPWVVRRLRRDHPDRHAAWLRAVRDAFPRIDALETTIRDEDRHCYLTIEHDSGHRVHSWGLSTGTLRSLALTLPGYLPDLSGTLLVEEPENGIHPDGVRFLYRAFESAADVQILATSHSPVLADLCDDAEQLTFTLGDRGETRIASSEP